MIKKLLLLCLAVSFGVGITVKAVASGKSPFEISYDYEAKKVEVGKDFELEFTIRVPEGHYIYADETDIDFKSLEGVIITAIKLPESKPHFDTYLNKEVNIFEGDATIKILGKIPKSTKNGERDVTATVSFRGCSQVLCFRTEEHDIPLKLDVTSAVAGEKEADQINPEPSEKVEAPAPELKPISSFRDMFHVQDFSLLLQRGFALTLLIVFLAGVLTSLTPCVWPVLPLILLFIGVHPHKRLGENFLVSAIFVAGLVITYSLLGILAVLFGKNLGFLFQNQIFLGLVVLFFIAMSLSMFGLFEMKLPHRLHQRLHKMGGKGYRGAFFAGMGTGLIASPCSGPVLAALLGHVALQRNFAQGFILLVTYGIGMGLLMIVLGTFYGELAGVLRLGQWMKWIKRLLGLILLLPAAFYMGSLFGWGDYAFMADADRPKIEWIQSEADALNFAKMSHRPIIMEFGAAWCPPCKMLDYKFFRRPEIVSLTYRLVPLYIDATVETGEVKAVIEKYKVNAWPTVLFLDPQGKVYDDLTVKGADDQNLLEKNMEEAVRRSLE